MIHSYSTEAVRSGWFDARTLVDRGREADRTTRAPRRPVGRRFRRFCLVLAVTLIGTLLFDQVWEKVLRDRVIVKRWGVVVPGKIYRSGQISRSLIDTILAKYGIQVIVDLQAPDPRDPNQRAEEAAAKVRGITQFHCPLGGNGTGNLESYAEALKVLKRCDAEGKSVLVHCAAGAQRTGGVVAAFRVLIQGDSPRHAYAEMMRYGWNPNRDDVLLTYLNDNMGQLADLLVQKHVLDAVPEKLPVIGP